jgi:hypothetical protein
MTGWSKGGEIERYAELIDTLAKRLEEVTLAQDILEVLETVTGHAG